MCRNDELSSTMSWVGCLQKDSELFILFAENSQILLKIYFNAILLSFIYLVAFNLLVNNQLNSSLLHIIVKLLVTACQSFTFYYLFFYAQTLGHFFRNGWSVHYQKFRRTFCNFNKRLKEQTYISMSFKYTSISMTLSIKGRQTIWLIFGRSVKPIPTGGRQIIHNYYYWHPRNFSPSGITV